MDAKPKTLGMISVTLDEAGNIGVTITKGMPMLMALGLMAKAVTMLGAGAPPEEKRPLVEVPRMVAPQDVLNGNGKRQ